jgi:hypothetical protein
MAHHDLIWVPQTLCIRHTSGSISGSCSAIGRSRRRGSPRAGLGVSYETAALVLEVWSIYSHENWLGPARRALRSDTARPIEDVLLGVVRDVAAVATEAFGLDELGTDSFVERLFHAVRPRDPCGLARD